MELGRVFAELAGDDLLIARVLYGAGLRGKELSRLRVKDVEFENEQLIVRDAKGQKYLFPAERLSRDPRSGAMRRHHMGDGRFAEA